MRACVDYMDLNDACPKDSFPLPRIDQIVDALAGMACCPSSMLFQVPLDPHAPTLCKANIFYHPTQTLLLQRNAIRVKECQSHLPKTGN